VRIPDPLGWGREGAGRARLRPGEGSRLVARGFRVGIDNSHRRGWDFGGPEASDLMEFPDRPPLDLVDSDPGNQIIPRWIEETVTRRQVFHLPERCLNPDMEIKWDGQFLLIWSRSREVYIIDLSPVCPQWGL